MSETQLQEDIDRMAGKPRPTLPSFRELLGQREVWVNKSGTTLAITSMDKNYALNTYNLLKRSMRRYAFGESWKTSLICTYGGSMGEMAEEALLDECDFLMRMSTADDETILQWLWTFPLIRALAKQAEMSKSERKRLKKASELVRMSRW